MKGAPSKYFPPASLSTGSAADGKLEFARKYDVDVGNRNQFWSGVVPLA